MSTILQNLVATSFSELIAILSIAFLGILLAESSNKAADSWSFVIALITSSYVCVVALFKALAFDKTANGFHYLERFDVLPQYNLTLTFGADGLSIVFVLLTVFIFPAMLLACYSVQQERKSFIAYMLGMEILLLLTFTTLDLFYFYVFFESLLIPMFILIGVWGARERKIKAANYFFLYTLFGSLFMLFGVLYLYFLTGSTNYFVLQNCTLELEQQCIVWVCFFLAFAVKMPLFPFHIWLPEAHVEAPTAGSMLLASLLLKLGGYGFLRFSLTTLGDASKFFLPIILTLSTLGVLYGSLSTLVQTDLKRIIAYSSVAHMNLVMLGLFSYSHQGIDGAIYLMVGHGVVSAALFFCIGVIYDRHHSRLLSYYGGLTTVMPLLATALLLFSLANMSFPGTSNFLGELLIFAGVFKKNIAALALSTSGIVLSAAYSVWLLARVTFGALKTRYITRFFDVNLRELQILLSFTIPMLVLGLTANFVLSYLELPVSAILLSAC